MDAQPDLIDAPAILEHEDGRREETTIRMHRQAYERLLAQYPPGESHELNWN